MSQVVARRVLEPFMSSTASGTKLVDRWLWQVMEDGSESWESFRQYHPETGESAVPAAKNLGDRYTERFERFEEVHVGGDDDVPEGLASVVVRLVELDGDFHSSELITAEVFPDDSDRGVYFDDRMIREQWSDELINSVLAPIERDEENWVA